MAGELQRWCATLLLVVFCVLGAALVAEAAADRGWRYRLSCDYWQSLTVGAGVLTVLNLIIALW